MPLPEWPALARFVACSVVLLVTPGPAVLYITARSLEQGRVAGLVAAAGMNCGGLVHVGLAATGLAALIAAAPAALAAVQLAGALYLVYLGARTLAALRRAGPGDADARVDPASLGRIFRESVVVNLLNPKALLFFVAFLPQFAGSRGSLPARLLALGVVFIGLAVVTDAAYALAAGAVGDRVRRNRRLLSLQRAVSGLVYLGLGLTAAWAALRP